VLTTGSPATPEQPAPSAPRGRAWRGSRLSPLRTAAVVAVVALVAAAVLWRVADDDGPPPLTRGDIDQAVASGLAKAQEDARNAPPDAATAYRTITPSLVTIITGGPRPTIGAGVVVKADGTVLTALHVVSGGGSLQVRFADGTAATGRIVSRQPETDIAVLGVDKLPQVVVPAVMGGGARVGDTVFPVGNPLGLEDSLTAGVVSALDRTIRIDTGQTLTGLIQFDAAVNPGNSGGPLLDRQGNVIGIVTGLANPSKQPYFVGIGFAVPIATAGGPSVGK
jgi:S1-C subfamily serine protease